MNLLTILIIKQATVFYGSAMLLDDAIEDAELTCKSNYEIVSEDEETSGHLIDLKLEIKCLK